MMASMSTRTPPCVAPLYVSTPSSRLHLTLILHSGSIASPFSDLDLLLFPSFSLSLSLVVRRSRSPAPSASIPSSGSTPCRCVPSMKVRPFSTSAKSAATHTPPTHNCRHLVSSSVFFFSSYSCYPITRPVIIQPCT